ncbi:hypothetical protein [Rhodanobacter sp. C05]|uniref:hypothetical protein n=1 Tax=Rhodanobacter sp. C05 TaxID=1945855 RepID=UPI001C2BEB44|nr:hypothetical protein [Rhodanobacter sp. C05]
MKGLNVFLWVGTPLLFLLVGALIWTAHQQNDPVSPHIAAQADSRPDTRQLIALLSRRPFSSVYYKHGQPLPAGFKCGATDRLVYHTLYYNGSTVTVPYVLGGELVRCEVDERSSHSL